MRAWFVVAVVGCGGGRAPAPSSSSPVSGPPRDPAIAEPWHRVPERPRLPSSREESMISQRRFGPLEPAAQSRAELWDPCVRDLLQSREPAVRNDIGDALWQCSTKCDREEQRVTFAPPRRTEYMTQSYIGFGGVLTTTTLRLELVAVHRGGTPPDRITLLAGSAKWTSPKTDATIDGDAATIVVPYTRSLARAIEAVLDSDAAIVRFEAGPATEDIEITDGMKQDLRLFADLSP